MNTQEKSADLETNAIHIAKALIVQNAILIYDEVCKPPEKGALDLVALDEAAERIRASVNFLRVARDNEQRVARWRETCQDPRSEG